jgi:hypothetical protein
VFWNSAKTLHKNKIICKYWLSRITTLPYVRNTVCSDVFKSWNTNPLRTHRKAKLKILQARFELRYRRHAIWQGIAEVLLEYMLLDFNTFNFLCIPNATNECVKWDQKHTSKQTIFLALKISEQMKVRVCFDCAIIPFIYKKSGAVVLYIFCIL